MNIKSNSMIQIRYLIILMVIALVIILAVVFIYIPRNRNGATSNNVEIVDKSPIISENEALADGMSFFPEYIYLNQPMKDGIIYTKDNKEIRISDFRGKNIIIMFWASTCEYCREEFEFMNQYIDKIAEYDDFELILLNKLDGNKETMEQAESFLDAFNVGVDSYYDIDLKVYNSLGIKIVPTLIGINKNGRTKIVNKGSIGGIESLESIIQYIKYGGEHKLESFIRNYLTDAFGGVKVNYIDRDGDTPLGSDVLSESQGIMMEYAVLSNNKELFDLYYSYVLDKMLSNTKLASWVVADNEPSSVNALLDDLRIYKSVYRANEIWGGYSDFLRKYADNIAEYNSMKNQLVDYYDFKLKEKANRLTICYIDVETLQLLREENSDIYSKIYDNAMNILEGGYIGEEFPFYYNYYDYKKQKYVGNDLNMIEALYTIWNLAKVNQHKEITIDWILAHVKKNGIKARYNIEGEVIEGYNYESTAIYGLAVLIGIEVDNKELVSYALARMEENRINNSNLIYDGTFTIDNGMDITSFDQCIPLLAYEYMDDHTK